MNRKGFVLLFLIVSHLIASGQEIKRVISLAPSITENIYLIGAQDKLVGCTSFCTDAIRDGIQQVGSAVEINMEVLFEQQPDIVLAMKLTKTQDVETMKRLGIKVVIMDSPHNFDEICEQTLFIAGLVGNETIALKLVEDTRKQVEEIKQQSLKLPHSKIFFQLGANPVFTVLDHTFMNDYITFCNGENIASGLTKGTITRESVVLQNPDYMFIATMGGFGEEELATWKQYSGIEAIRKGRIFLIDSETSCSPTPANFVSALEVVFNSIRTN